MGTVTVGWWGWWCWVMLSDLKQIKLVVEDDDEFFSLLLVLLGFGFLFSRDIGLDFGGPFWWVSLKFEWGISKPNFSTITFATIVTCTIVSNEKNALGL